jgi:hypothetical protein
MNRRRKPMAEKISLAALEAAIIAYYDNLSDAEVEEDKLGGEFAGRELAWIAPSDSRYQLFNRRINAHFPQLVPASCTTERLARRFKCP